MRMEQPIDAPDRLRFQLPLYTIAEAARIVDVPTSTLSTWAQGYSRQTDQRSTVGKPIITYVPPDVPGRPAIPFVGLTEALVLAAIRLSGVPMQRIRPALKKLQEELGIDHALASEKLYTDGAELLYDFGQRRRGTKSGRAALMLVVVRSGQRVFVEAIQEYLQNIVYGPDGYAALIHVPAFPHADVVADPSRSFGAPIFERGGTRVDEVLQRFWAGESLDELTSEFGVPRSQLEDVVRVTSRRAA